MKLDYLYDSLVKIKFVPLPIFNYMKAIIPVAGFGRKLRPHTHTLPKSLIPVAGKPILSHIIDELLENGINEIVFIIGYLGNKIENYVNECYPDLQCYFVVQSEGKGTAHAVWLAKEFIENEDQFLIIYGDTIVHTDYQKILASENSILGIQKVNNPSHFGVVEVENQIVKKLIEKPQIPKSNLALVGLFKINESKIFIEALSELVVQNTLKNNELHLTDALMKMVLKNVVFKTYEVETWFDCGQKDILLQTNKILLKNTEYPNLKEYTNTIFIKPYSIGKDTIIENCIVGPNVSIGNNCTIKQSIIKNSIVGNQSNLDYANLENSVIGSESTLKGNALVLNLGDYAEITFS